MADVAERHLARPLAGDLREAEQEVEEPARRAELGPRRADPFRHPRRIGARGRPEPALDEFELQGRGRERVGEGMPQRKQDASGSAGRMRR